MSSYQHFTLDERKCLQNLLADGLSLRKIASILHRAPSSVSREIARNKPKHKPHHKPDNPYWYNHWRAQNLYIERRRSINRAVLCPDTPAWDFIVEGLNSFWSPAAICGRWHLLYPERRKLCASTIYRYIKQKRFPNISVKKNLRRRGKKKTPRNAQYNTIHPDRLIPDWPKEIKERLRVGDWEGDTVFGGVGKGALVTLVDRKSLFVRIGLLRTREAQPTRQVIEDLLRGFPVNSISLDNGAEFAEFRLLEENLHTMIYFAEPHKPWQRGINENTNDLIRFFFPKGFDFRTVTGEEVFHVEYLLNYRPRKSLGWKTPAEIFFKSVALA